MGPGVTAEPSRLPRLEPTCSCAHVPGARWAELGGAPGVPSSAPGLQPAHSIESKRGPLSGFSHLGHLGPRGGGTGRQSRESRGALACPLRGRQRVSDVLYAAHSEPAVIKAVGLQRLLAHFFLKEVSFVSATRPAESRGPRNSAVRLPGSREETGPSSGSHAHAHARVSPLRKPNKFLAGPSSVLFLPLLRYFRHFEILANGARRL